MTRRVNAPAHRAPVGAALAALAASEGAASTASAGVPIAGETIRGGVAAAAGRAAPVAANQAPLHTRFEEAALRIQVRDALVGLEWKIGIARTAVDEARAHVGGNATLEAWILEALRRCPLPRA